MHARDAEFRTLLAGLPVEVDRSGALEHVLRALRAVRPHSAALVRGAHDLVVSPEMDQPTVAWLAQHAAELPAMPAHSTSALRVAGRRVLLAGAAERVALAVMLSPASPEPAPAELCARLAGLAPLAAALVEQARELGIERRRGQQLLAEQRTIWRAHEQVVAEVLHERDERLRDKRQQIELLESEVQRRSAALEDALRRAEQASHAKSHFLANMSHEIRTPMTAIIGYAELLADPKLTADERAAAAQTILRNSRHLLNLINDILDLSKIEAGRVTTERIACDPRALLTDIELTFRPRAAAKGLSFDVRAVEPLPAAIVTDPTRLRQILVNLVGNAIKFTEAGFVRVELAGEPGDRLVLRVSDSGLGLTPEQREAVFTPFTQGDSSTTRRFGGTGLGLAISRRLAEALGGRLQVDSAPGSGSVFTLVLDAARLVDPPVSGAGEGAAPADEQDAALTTRLSGRVLLAEDGPDNQRLISFVLERAGAEVTVVENGQVAVAQALGALQGGRAYDLIVLDMQMPVLDGYQAAAALRAAGYGGAILALTARGMCDDRERCMRAGCDAYEVKPIEPSKLVRRVAELLAGGGAGA